MPSAYHKEEKRCTDCGTTSTPLWRLGPLGPKTMCNACGIKWKRRNGSSSSGSGNSTKKKARPKVDSSEKVKPAKPIAKIITKPSKPSSLPTSNPHKVKRRSKVFDWVREMSSSDDSLPASISGSSPPLSNANEAHSVQESPPLGNSGAFSSVAAALRVDQVAEEIRTSWKRIEVLLKEKDPGSFVILMNQCKGASETEISEAETALGHKFPADFRASLAVHDIRACVPALSSYGYRNSLSDIARLSKKYKWGPLSARLANGDQASPMSSLTEAAPMDGLLHLSCTEENSYTFLSLDCRGTTDGSFDAGIFFLDFGVLIGEPEGRMVSRNFLSWLKSFVACLERDTIPSQIWPPVALGISGSETILNMMPDRRRLVFPARDPLVQPPAIREALQDARDYPDMHLIESVLNEDSSHMMVEMFAPPPDCRYPEMKWDLSRCSSVAKAIKLSDGGRSAHIDGYSMRLFGDKVMTEGRNYFEIRLGAHVTILGIGISNADVREQNLWELSITEDGSLSNSIHDQHGSRIASSPMALFGMDPFCFQKGDLVGVLVDLDERQVEFYVNRQLQGAISLNAENSILTPSVACPFSTFRAHAYVHMADLSFEQIAS